jgi:hypothetical protein
MQLQDEDEYVLGYVYNRRSFKIRMSKEYGTYYRHAAAG